MHFLWTKELLAVPLTEVGSLVMPLILVGPTGSSKRQLCAEVPRTLVLGSQAGPHGVKQMGALSLSSFPFLFARTSGFVGMRLVS